MPHIHITNGSQSWSGTIPEQPNESTVPLPIIDLNDPVHIGGAGPVTWWIPDLPTTPVDDIIDLCSDPLPAGAVEVDPYEAACENLAWPHVDHDRWTVDGTPLRLVATRGPALNVTYRFVPWPEECRVIARAGFVRPVSMTSGYTWADFVELTDVLYLGRVNMDEGDWDARIVRGPLHDPEGAAVDFVLDNWWPGQTDDRLHPGSEVNVEVPATHQPQVAAHLRSMVEDWATTRILLNAEPIDATGSTDATRH